MPYQIPPWLAPVNPAPYFMQGVSQGADVAQAQNRTELAIQEMTLRREAQQREAEAQNLANQRAAQDMALQQQAMRMRAQAEALKWQGQQEYDAMIRSGKTPEEAFIATAPKLMPGGLGPFLANRERQAEAAKQNQERNAQAANRLAETVRYHDAMIGKDDIEPEISVKRNPVTGEDIPVIQGGGRFQVLPTQANKDQKALQAIEDQTLKGQQKTIETALANNPSTREKKRLEDDLTKVKTSRSNIVTSASASKSSGRVRVKSPDGKIGSIPADQVETALSIGYTRL